VSVEVVVMFIWMIMSLVLLDICAIALYEVLELGARV
jgi:hypothetical protein